MCFAKDTKFWKYTAGKIGSENIDPKSQDLQDKKINSRKNSHYIQQFVILLPIYLYILKFYKVISILLLSYFYHVARDY